MKMKFSLNKHLVSTYYVHGTVPGTGESDENGAGLTARPPLSCFTTGSISTSCPIRLLPCYPHWTRGNWGFPIQQAWFCPSVSQTLCGPGRESNPGSAESQATGKGREERLPLARRGRGGSRSASELELSSFLSPELSDSGERTEWA